jgi:hypothetical protein
VAQRGGNYGQPKSQQDREVEQLARELAERIRALPNRHAMIDYAVSLLNQAGRDVPRAEPEREDVAQPRMNDPFDPFAFGIALFALGALLAITGLLTGFGLLMIGIAGAMVLYGLLVSVLSRSREGGPT